MATTSSTFDSDMDQSVVTPLYKQVKSFALSLQGQNMTASELTSITRLWMDTNKSRLQQGAEDWAVVNQTVEMLVQEEYVAISPLQESVDIAEEAADEACFEDEMVDLRKEHMPSLYALGKMGSNGDGKAEKCAKGMSTSKKKLSKENTTDGKQTNATKIAHKPVNYEGLDWVTPGYMKTAEYPQDPSPTSSPALSATVHKRRQPGALIFPNFRLSKQKYRNAPDFAEVRTAMKRRMSSLALDQAAALPPRTSDVSAAAPTSYALLEKALNSPPAKTTASATPHTQYAEVMKDVATVKRTLIVAHRLRSGADCRGEEVLYDSGHELTSEHKQRLLVEKIIHVLENEVFEDETVWEDVRRQLQIHPMMGEQSLHDLLNHEK